MNRYVLVAIVIGWPLAAHLAGLSTSTLSWFAGGSSAVGVRPYEEPSLEADARKLVGSDRKRRDAEGGRSGGGFTPHPSHEREMAPSSTPTGSTTAVDDTAAATGPLADGAVAAVGASLSGIGDAGMQEFCASGGAGVGFDAASGRYEATCGNHSWSASHGGTIAAGEAGERVAAWETATTPGGNAYRIDCTGAGVGTTQDGHTVDVRTDLALGGGIVSGGTITSVESAGAGYAPDSLRGYLLVMQSGVAWPAERHIVGNDADTIMIHADSPFVAAPSPGDLYAIYNPFPSNCYDAGEVVILNFMADAMLAQDLTKPGGTIYFPDLSDGKATIYVHTGCGRKGMNLGTTAFVGNNCPVLRGHNDHHYQRHLNMGYANVTWNFGPPDFDLMSELDGRGRSGVYVINDTGGATEATRYCDPADQVLFNTVAGRSITTGSATFTSKGCVPVSTTDPRCNVSSNDPLQSGWQLYHYYRASWSDQANTLVNDTDTTDPQAICVNDSATSMGVCEDDPRVVCTVPGNAARTGLFTGGCQFGAASENDIGPCDSPVDAIAAWNDTRPDRYEQWVTIAQRVAEFPGTTFGTSVDGSFARVWSVPNAACGAGETGATLSVSGSGTGNPDDGQWTLPIHRIAPHAEGQATLGWLDPSWHSPNGGVVGGTFTPNGWWGRDVDADGASDPWDCLSGDTADTHDDEAGCDTASVVSFGVVRAAGWQGSVFALGSHDTETGAGSWFDSTDFQYQNRLHDVVIKRGKRGRIADWTDVDTRNLLVEDNSCFGSVGWNTCLSLGFNSRNEYSDITLRQNSGLNIIGSPTIARQIKLRDIDLIGNSAVNGQIDIGGGGGWTLEDIQCSGGTWPCIMLTNFFAPVTNVSIRGVRVFGQTASANVPFFTGAKSAIDFTRFFDTPIHLLRNVSIEDIRVESGVDDAVLVSFDDDPASETSEINVGRSTVSIRDSSIDCIAGATGCIAIGVGDHAAGGGASFDATDDNGCGGTGCGTGIWSETYVPIWTNLRVDGVAIADNPWPTIAAEDAGDCNALPHGTLVRINDDAAIGACTDTNGILDGGGSAVSTCECDGLGVWKSSSASGVTSTGTSAVGGIPTFTDANANEVVDSGATIVNGVLTLAPSTVRPSEIRYREDADFGSNYVATRAMSAGTNLTGDIELVLTRVSRALAAAYGARGPVVGAVSNGGTFDTPEGLCDLAYYAASGVIQTCVDGTAKQYDPSTAAPTWIGCSEAVDSGTYFEVVCNVE